MSTYYPTVRRDRKQNGSSSENRTNGEVKSTKKDKDSSIGVETTQGTTRAFRGPRKTKVTYQPKETVVTTPEKISTEVTPDRITTATAPSNVTTSSTSRGGGTTTTVKEDAGGTISFRIMLRGGLSASAANPPVCAT